MRDREPNIQIRGYGFGHILTAMFAGVVAGAAAAYLTAPASGTDSRRRIRETVDGTKESVARVPLAIRKATEAAREAFTEALERDGHAKAA